MRESCCFLWGGDTCEYPRCLTSLEALVNESNTCKVTPQCVAIQYIDREYKPHLI